MERKTLMEMYEHFAEDNKNLGAVEYNRRLNELLEQMEKEGLIEERKVEINTIEYDPNTIYDFFEDEEDDDLIDDCDEEDFAKFLARVGLL